MHLDVAAGQRQKSRKMIKRSLIVCAEALVISLIVLYLTEFLDLAFVREAGGHVV